jgi:hypothetical protein
MKGLVLPDKRQIAGGLVNRDGLNARSGDDPKHGDQRRDR